MSRTDQIHFHLACCREHLKRVSRWNRLWFHGQGIARAILGV